MPELPEIETVKLQLQKYLVGKEISSLEKIHPKSVVGDIGKIRGMRIMGIKRIGKMLIIELENDLCIAIHFKMTGQLVLKKPESKNPKSKIKNSEKRIVGGHPSVDWIGKLPSKHTRAVFNFKNGDKMFFNDQRIFGWIKILNSKELKSLKFLKIMGKEPWDINDKDFYEMIHKKKKAIKLIIMDQEVISGLGNIYANDALWEAGIHPGRSAGTIRQEDGKIIRRSLIKVLREGIKYGGASASDQKYVSLDGTGGKYQEHFRVYEREGEKCLRNDGGIIKKIKLGGRGTYFCHVCQT